MNVIIPPTCIKFSKHKREMKETETGVATVIAALATAVAMGYIKVPVAVLQSSLTQAFLLVMVLVLFAYSPVVGIAAMVLFAVLLFNRNVQKTSVVRPASRYGEDNIAHQPVATVQPAQAIQNQPREYNEFKDTYEPYQSPNSIGQFPLDESRPSSEARLESYYYRPDATTGENTFERMGPNIDQKNAFAY
jgi:hypothetical protein